MLGAPDGSNHACRLQGIKISSKLCTHFRMLQAECNLCLQVAKFGAAIVTNAVETIGKQLFFTHQCGDAVGKLDFATRTWFDVLQMVK